MYESKVMTVNTFDGDPGPSWRAQADIPNIERQVRSISRQ